jgi:hypothetical protein
MLDFLQFLRKKYSEYNNNPIRQGTIVDELAVKPTGLALQDFYNTLVENQFRGDIRNWPQMTEEQLDFFGSKFFFPRITGVKAFGVIRIWIDTSADVLIGTNFKAVSSDGLNYVATTPGYVPQSAMTVANDSFGKYYFDIHITAEAAGSMYNKSAGDITSITGVDFDYSHVTNLQDLVPGTPHETNTEYANRLIYSLNDRSMTNKRSLYAGLKNRFPFVYSMYVAGAGDKYMTRDFLQAVDPSQPFKQQDFLGKIPGDNNVKHTAYYSLFPPEPGSRGAAFFGPFSIYSNYPYNQTIEAVDLLNMDPAYHGYPLYQEATEEMYKGLYFDDFRTFMNITTAPLFNIQDEATSVNSVIPNDTWIVGANAAKNGDYGITPDLSASLGKTDLVQFSGTDIILGGGTGTPITAGKNIAKRLGVKITGSFTTPTDPTNTGALNASFQVIVGGKNRIDSAGYPIVDSYNGIGFGVVMFRSAAATPSGETNAAVFFSNSQGYYDTIVHSTDASAYSGMSSLAEQPALIQEGRTYDFELVVYDAGYDNINGGSNPSAPILSIKISPSDPTGSDDVFGANGSVWTLPNSRLQNFVTQLVNPNSDSYGLMMKLTLDAPLATNAAKWTFSDLLATDIASHRATALFMFNVDGLEEPLEFMVRASGNGAINNTIQPGYTAYVWNMEIPGKITGSSSLNSGSWEKLDDASDPQGTKDIVSASLSQELTGIDRYVISSRYGNVIIFMLAATGQSKTGILANNDVLGDIDSSLTIDYVRLQDLEIDRYHGRNKADIYVNTIKNVDNFTTLTKAPPTIGATQSYFTISADEGFTMPIAQITGVTDTDTGQILAESDYYTFRDNFDFYNSVQDVIYLVAQGHSNIEVSYTIYNNVNIIQDYFDSSDYGKVYGDILVRHKYPVYLDCELFYSGATDPDDLISAIRTYADSNFDRIFNVRQLVQYLYDNGYMNNNQPFTFTYSRINEKFEIETGSFDDLMTIRDIEFFRLRNLIASKS